MIWSVRNPWLRLLLIAIGTGVTLHVARLPAYRPLEADPASPANSRTFVS
jgi:hypothetical protein